MQGVLLKWLISIGRRVGDAWEQGPWSGSFDPASPGFPHRQPDEGGEESLVSQRYFYFPLVFHFALARRGGGGRLASAWRRRLEITQESKLPHVNSRKTSRVPVCDVKPLSRGKSSRVDADERKKKHPTHPTHPPPKLRQESKNASPLRTCTPRNAVSPSKEMP